MLKLFKEEEKEYNLENTRREIKRDSALNEFFLNQNKKEKFNETILRGERVRNDLKKTAQSIQNKACRNNVILCEESLGWNLGEQKLNQQRTEKLRQLLWSNSPELRELRQKILIADVTRDQAMQIAQKQASVKLEKEEGDCYAEAARLEKQKLEEEEKKKALEQLIAKKQYHKDLDELRSYKHRLQSSNEEDIAREKNTIDEIKKQIEEDRLAEIKKKVEKQLEYQKQAQELIYVRQGLRLEEKLRDRAQELKADEFRKSQELRAEKQERLKRLSLEQRLQLQEELLRCLEQTQADKLREEHIRTELAVEEKDACAQAEELEAERRKRRIREDLQRVHEMQVYVKKQKEELQKKEEELYRQQLMTNMYEEDRLEYMSLQKQRKKRVEHSKLAQAMLEEARKKKAIEKAREMADHKYQQSLEEERKKMVNEEKLRFLKECAGELLGYLPKGIFSDDQCIENLGNEFKKFYFRQTE